VRREHLPTPGIYSRFRDRSDEVDETLTFPAKASLSNDYDLSVTAQNSTSRRQSRGLQEFVPPISPLDHGDELHVGVINDFARWRGCRTDVPVSARVTVRPHAGQATSWRRLAEMRTARMRAARSAERRTRRHAHA
jgi:hypothetical protein